jgi:hypothetical protein
MGRKRLVGAVPRWITKWLERALPGLVALLYLVPGGAILLFAPDLQAIGSYLLAVGVCACVIVAYREVVPARRSRRLSAHSATIEAIWNPLTSYAWLAGGLVLAAIVTWAAWGVIWTRHGGLSVVGVSIAVPLWLTAAWMLMRGAIGAADALSFGSVTLEFDAWPIRVGSLVRGHVVVQRGAGRLAGIDVRLVLTHHVPILCDGQTAGTRLDEVWSTLALAAPDLPDVPGAFAFALRIPANLRATQIIANYAGENEQVVYTWRLHVAASDGSRASLDRAFDVPVAGAGA